MKKNIIIIGSSRSGKTSLSLQICRQYGYSLINLDSVVSGIEKGLPELNIARRLTGKDDTKKLTSFLKAYLHSLNSYNNLQRGINYVIEGSYIELKDIKKLQKKFIVIVLVEKYRTAKEYYDKMLHYDKSYDWTAQIRKSELYKYAKNLKKDNDRIIRYCNKNGIIYYDTSKERDVVFKEVIGMVESKINVDEESQIIKKAVHYGELCINVTAKKYLLEALQRKYKGLFYFDDRFQEACYSLVFSNKKNDTETDKVEKFFVSDFEYFPEYKIDNKKKVCNIYFDDSYDQNALKRIIRKFVYVTFVRFYEEKGAILLHCSAVEKNNEVYIFPAAKFSGKTVTQLNFLNNGYNFITNDFLIIDNNNSYLNFLVAPLYIGIRKTKPWIDLPENFKYAQLKNEGYVRIDNNRIYIRPIDLIAMNNVNFGNIEGKLKYILSPKYCPNENFSIDKMNQAHLLFLLKDNIFYNYLDYNSKNQDYKNPIYKMKAGFNEKKLNGNYILSMLLKTKAYSVKQNENNYMSLINFLDKKGEKTR